MAALSVFGGIVPRTPWHLLPENTATLAHNVKLRNGKVQAWRERLAVSEVVEDAKSFSVVGCCYLSWDTCVDLTEYVVDYGRLYLTGRSDRPEVAVLDKCVPTYLYLGVPQPDTTLSVSGTEQYGRDCSERSYMCTFTNVFGEESAPSIVSEHFTIKDGSPVVITNFPTTPDGYGITGINLYRTSTAYRQGNEKEQEELTDFLRVAELPLTVTSYTDVILERDLGMACTTEEVRLPPEDLRHISHVKGTGILTGVTNNGVHFTNPFQPYNWPAEHDLTLPHNIVNMVTVNNHVMVSTDSYPYVIEAGGGCEARQCRPVSESDAPLPDISCGYANSAISTPFGMVYSSKDGLVLVTANARFQIITSNWFSTDDWVKIRPDTVRLAYWRGYLICITDMISFMLEVDGDTYEDFNLGRLVTISDDPVDLRTTESGELLMMEGDFIYQWDAGRSFRPYAWESKEFNFAGLGSPVAGKVRTTGTTFRLLTPIDGLYYEREVYRDEPFRISRLGRNLRYRVGFYGTGDVEYALVGTAYSTINAGQ